MFQHFISFLKNWSLLVAMLVGVLFHRQVNYLSGLTPVLIFFMLLVTFCKLSPRKVRFHPLHGWLLLIQVAGSFLVYLALFKVDKIVAESALICLLAPTATAAPVITRMLGGSVATLTTYTLMCNLAIALFSPLLFTFVGAQPDMSFLGTFGEICLKVMPLIILPLLLGWFMQRHTPRLNRRITQIKDLPFYLWNIALVIVTGKTVCFLLDQEDTNQPRELVIAGLSLFLCIFQFYAGKQIGKRYKKTIAGGQSLGQKNTILAIWMAQTFMNPISSLGPAAYVLWQNIFNAWQLYQRRREQYHVD
jgi:BASS family bile acid:Na+ symporter